MSFFPNRHYLTPKQRVFCFLLYPKHIAQFDTHPNLICILELINADLRFIIGTGTLCWALLSWLPMWGRLRMNKCVVPYLHWEYVVAVPLTLNRLRWSLCVTTFFWGWNRTMCTLGANKQPKTTKPLRLTEMHIVVVCTCKKGWLNECPTINPIMTSTKENTETRPS